LHNDNFAIFKWERETNWRAVKIAA
jgi:hypothetical protein